MIDFKDSPPLKISERLPYFTAVLQNDSKLVRGGAGIYAKGLFGCIAIAGYIPNMDNSPAAFITHYGFKKIAENIQAAKMYARYKPQKIIIFHEDESLVAHLPDELLAIPHYSENMSFSKILGKIRGDVGIIFPHAEVRLVPYGVADYGDETLRSGIGFGQSRQKTSNVGIDLQNKYYFSDMQTASLQTL